MAGVAAGVKRGREGVVEVAVVLGEQLPLDDGALRRGAQSKSQD